MVPSGVSSGRAFALGRSSQSRLSRASSNDLGSNVCDAALAPPFRGMTDCSGGRVCGSTFSRVPAPGPSAPMTSLGKREGGAAGGSLSLEIASASRSLLGKGVSASESCARIVELPFSPVVIPVWIS